jgi:thiol-disulfide isomerase/thioredoxin
VPGAAGLGPTRTVERLKPGAGPAGLPSFPLGPGRGGYSRRARGFLAIALAVFALVAVVLGAILATGPGGGPVRVVTIPAADRAASPALLRAAEAVGFQPHSEPNAGQVESQRLVAAHVPSSSALLPVGAAAPPFSLKTPTGAAVRLRDLRGRVVLLEFFATWCPHCDAEAPHLERLYASLSHASVAFVAVNADGETAPSVLAYHIFFSLSFPALLDPGTRAGSWSSPGLPGPVTSTYRVNSYPTFYVLDRAGRIVWAGQGEQPDLLIRRELRLATATGA